MSIPRTSIALVTLIMLAWASCLSSPLRLLNNLRFHPPRAVLKSCYWEQEPLQRIPIAPDPPPPSSSTARHILSTWEQGLSEGRNLRSPIAA